MHDRHALLAAIKDVAGSDTSLRRRFEHVAQLLTWGAFQHDELWRAQIGDPDYVHRIMEDGPSWFPEFALPNDEGGLTSLDDLLTNGPSVICICRGHWCPFGLVELLAYGEMHSLLERHGTTFVAIMPDTQRYTHALRQTYALPFPILSDIDSDLTFELRQTMRTGRDLRAAFALDGVDLKRFQNSLATRLPIPGLFLLDSAGQVVTRHLTLDFENPAEPSAILDQIKALRPSI